MGEVALEIPWNPDSTHFPSRKDLPRLPGAPEDAAWVWGKDDYIGRLNLLTPARVKAAAAEIRTGEMARLDLPLHVPAQPAFGRETFQHTIKPLVEGAAYDDVYTMNTQSGTQWDGFRHVAHQNTKTFYNRTTASDFTGPTDNLKCSIHHWSEHGFSGRAGILPESSYAQHLETVFTNTSVSSPRLPSLRHLPKSEVQLCSPPLDLLGRASCLWQIARY